jgi:hypothetical protein
MPESPQNPNPVATKPACDAGPSATEPGEAARRKPRYCARGKIALLKKPVRDKINECLLRGLSYPAILQELGSDVQDLNANTLCRYHKGPYRHWLREQHWLAEALVKEEAAAELCEGLKDINVNQAAVQTTIVQIYDSLRELTAGNLKEMLTKDPRSYARIVNALSRLSKESLNLKKHRDEVAKAASLELKKLDPNRQFSEREEEILNQRMEDYFRKPARKRPPPEQPNPQPPPPPPPPTTNGH